MQSSTDAVAIMRTRLGALPGNTVRVAKPNFSDQPARSHECQTPARPLRPSYMQGLEKRTGRQADWLRAMLAQRHSNVMALANEPARNAWAALRARAHERVRSIWCSAKKRNTCTISSSISRSRPSTCCSLSVMPLRCPTSRERK